MKASRGCYEHLQAIFSAFQWKWLCKSFHVWPFGHASANLKIDHSNLNYMAKYCEVTVIAICFILSPSLSLPDPVLPVVYLLCSVTWSTWPSRIMTCVCWCVFLQLEEAVEDEASCAHCSAGSCMHVHACACIPRSMCTSPDTWHGSVTGLVMVRLRIIFMKATSQSHDRCCWR